MKLQKRNQIFSLWLIGLRFQHYKIIKSHLFAFRHFFFHFNCFLFMKFFITNYEKEICFLLEDHQIKYSLFVIFTKYALKENFASKQIKKRQVISNKNSDFVNLSSVYQSCSYEMIKKNRLQYLCWII